MAVLNYEDYDRLPIVHFGFWRDTLNKWSEEGHLTRKDAEEWADGNQADKSLGDKLGFDFNWNNLFRPHAGLRPGFEGKTLRVREDGSREVLTGDGTIILDRNGIVSIRPHIDHLLKDRQSWCRLYAPKLQFHEERVLGGEVNTDEGPKRFDQGGLDWLQAGQWRDPLGINCGSLFGAIRNWLGVEGLSYLCVDDEALFDDIVETVGDLSYRCIEKTLASGARFDFAHFWEDICFKNGPLVNPAVFQEKVGPQYKRITELIGKYGIEIVSVDCDGKIDGLVPIWLNNGVNTMFPIEVGTWGASIAPWRKQYGRELRGVGGANKTVFAHDRAAVDTEIERLKPLVELGGYLPCPDHRIAPDAKWENVRYYCDSMRKVFGG